MIDETIPGCNVKANALFRVKFPGGTLSKNPVGKKEGRHVGHPGTHPIFVALRFAIPLPDFHERLTAEPGSAKWQGPFPLVASGWRNGPGVKAGVADPSGGMEAMPERRSRTSTLP